MSLHTPSERESAQNAEGEFPVGHAVASVLLAPASPRLVKAGKPHRQQASICRGDELP
jgi:hypothetical protein